MHTKPNNIAIMRNPPHSLKQPVWFFESLLHLRVDLAAVEHSEFCCACVLSNSGTCSRCCIWWARRSQQHADNATPQLAHIILQSSRPVWHKSISHHHQWLRRPACLPLWWMCGWVGGCWLGPILQQQHWRSQSLHVCCTHYTSNSKPHVICLQLEMTCDIATVWGNCLDSGSFVWPWLLRMSFEICNAMKKGRTI